MSNVQKAMVMAAGLGTRMRPITDTLPKPLVRVGNKTLIDRVLDWLGESGVEEAVVNTHYLAPQLETHLAGRIKPRVVISHEEVLLETGGGVRKALPLLGSDPFFVTNSDTLCLDGKFPALSRLSNFWDDTRDDILLLVHPVATAVGYEGSGDFFIEPDGKLRRRGAELTAPFVFTGTQLLHPRIFADTEEGPFSLNLLYDRAIQSGRIRAIVHDGHWLHVGDPKGLAQAEIFLAH